MPKLKLMDFETPKLGVLIWRKDGTSEFIKEVDRIDFDEETNVFTVFSKDVDASTDGDHSTS